MSLLCVESVSASDLVGFEFKRIGEQRTSTSGVLRGVQLMQSRIVEVVDAVSFLGSLNHNHFSHLRLFLVFRKFSENLQDFYKFSGDLSHALSTNHKHF